MNKIQMRKVAREVSRTFTIDDCDETWEETAKKIKVPANEMDATNPRFQWCIDNSYYVNNDCTEASMLLSEASRKDFDYQEPTDV
jgi:hypothetical protein